MDTQQPDDLEFMTVPQTGASFGSQQRLPPVPAQSNVAPPPPPSQSLDGVIRSSSHPGAALFHLLFKLLAVFFYMFGSLVSSNFIFRFVLVVLLLAADFWTVKNVSGRLLVGLRWWSTTSEDGKTTWIFESADSRDRPAPSSSDAALFWSALYLQAAVWSVFLLIDVITLNLTWLALCVVAIALAAANIVGYYKCSNDQKGRVANLLQQGAEFGFRSALSNPAMRSAVFQMFTQPPSTSNNVGYQKV